MTFIAKQHEKMESLNQAKVWCVCVHWCGLGVGVSLSPPNLLLFFSSHRKEQSSKCVIFYGK